MRRTTHVLIVCGLLILASFFLSQFFSPLSTIAPAGGLPEPNGDPYARFDSLRTDLSDYLWPTEASKKMSSGFASFRNLHFHAGIDISTNGRTGYKVFASRDGFISRVSVSPSGYGKLLHVRHPDGFTTSYAHLKRFNAGIDSMVREQQYRKESYSVDIRFDEARFPVSRGDVIAYTGDTGVGPAHFHFEIRDEHMNPVNPLLAPAVAEAIRDDRAPEFQKVSFAPFDYAGRVNGSAATVIRSVRNLGHHRYSLPGIIHLTGAIGVSVKGTDQVSATWQRSNVYRYELYLDSTRLFTSTMDRFSAKETEQIALHYDWPALLSGEGRFQKLFLETGNQLPLYAGLPKRGGILVTTDFPRGNHELRIVASDFAGNTSEVKATLGFDEPPFVDIRIVGEQYFLVPLPASPLASISIGSKTPGRKSWRTQTFEPSKLTSTTEGYVLPIDPAGPRIFRVLAKDEQGSQSFPVFFAPGNSRSSSTSLTLAKEFIRDYLLVTVSSHLPLTLRPSLWLIDGEQKSLLDINAKDERTYVATFPLRALKGNTIRLEANGMVNGTSVQAFDEFSVFPVSPEEGSTIIAGDGEFIVDFPPRGVYEPLFCRIEKTDEGYEVLPNDVLLDLGATMYYRVPESADSASLGLYNTGDDGYSLLSTTIEKGMFKGRVRNLLGHFAVRKDGEPPSITNVRARFSRGRLRLTARLTDSGSGISADKIRVTVDDRLLIATYDPYARVISFDEPFPATPGKHLVRVEASDRMGNTGFATSSFISGP